jgi:hypothetical protein
MLTTSAIIHTFFLSENLFCLFLHCAAAATRRVTNVWGTRICNIEIQHEVSVYLASLSTVPLEDRTRAAITGRYLSDFTLSCVYVYIELVSLYSACW